jgi:hypothetical protein
VFVASPTGGIRHVYLLGGQWSADAAPAYETTTTEVACSPWSANIFHLFRHSAQGTLVSNSYISQWGNAWIDTGITMPAGLASVSSGSTALEIFGTDEKGSVWHAITPRSP